MSVFGNPEVMGFGVMNDPTNPSVNRGHAIPVPNTGADVSPLGFGAEATLINGGGYSRNSWTSHKTYNFSWGDSASPELASIIRGYRNGTYGRGLIVFSDPMYYRTNLAPAYYADPAMSENFEGPQLIRQGGEVTYPTTPSNSLGLPAKGARYAVESGTTLDAVNFFPVVVAPGHSVGFGIVGTVERGAAEVLGFNVGTPEPGSSLALLPPSGADVISITYRNNTASPLVGAFFIQTSADFIGTIYGVTMRVGLPGEIIDRSGPWLAGEGNSGCRFVGDPSIINYNGVGGGQVGLACTLKETGAWE